MKQQRMLAAAAGPMLLLVFTFLTACGGSSGSGIQPTAEPSMQPTPGPTAPPSQTVQNRMLGVEVKNYFSGEAVADALLRVTWQNNGMVQELNTVTGISGKGDFSVPENVQRFAITAEKNYFANQTIIVETDYLEDDISALVKMLPVNAVVNFDSAIGGDITVEGLNIVSIDGGSFLNEDGSAYEGTIDAEITLLDPSGDPEIMPGGYQTYNASTATPAAIESFGAVSVNFLGENNQGLNLASGERAIVRIPVADSVVNPPLEIPLYYFDESQGYWVEEGTAILMNDATGNYYQGEVSHFSTWNCDDLFDTVYIEGCVVDGEGNPVAGADVETQGSDYIGTNKTRTDAQGNFRVAAKKSSIALLSATKSAESRTQSLATGETDMRIEQCLVISETAASIKLTWGENPRDLDSHFYGPSGVDGGIQFHVYYGNRSVMPGSGEIFLDVDDMTSFGPEIITVSEFPFAGEYRYFVHHYSGSSDIAASPARVELSLGGENVIFSPPGGVATECWEVFTLIADGGGNVQIQRTNAWRDNSMCTGAFFTREQSNSVLGHAEKPQNPSKSRYQKAIDRKYYMQEAQ